jgi:hypothetical protein
MKQHLHTVPAARQYSQGMEGNAQPVTLIQPTETFNRFSPLSN